MLDPETHLVLQTNFGRRAPDVLPKRCLNTRHKNANCTLCLDACPVDAIQLTASAPITPQLQADMCIHCGICLAVCPTDVFSQPLVPETTLLRTHFELPAEQAVAIICPLHPQPQENAAPVEHVIRHQRCLAAFSEEHLLTLSADGQRTLWLDDSWCRRCPIGSVHNILLHTVQSTNALLKTFARAESIHTHTLNPAQLQAKPRSLPLTESSQPQVSRRGLFQALGKVVQQRASEVLENLPHQATDPLPVDQRLPVHLPPSRKHLNEHLAGLLPIPPEHLPRDDDLPAANIPYGQVQIDAARCSGCNLCARFCPTGALTFTAATAEVDAETPVPFTLTFQTNLCLDCNICVIICPENALTLADAVPGEAIRHPQPQTLIADDLVPCANCGVPTRPLTPDAPALCYICRASQNTFNHADLLNDLLDKLT